MRGWIPYHWPRFATERWVFHCGKGPNVLVLATSESPEIPKLNIRDLSQS